ncbi:MAG: sigma-70 family RNA polymerase sigma factor [Planctomycetota bacterium]
MREDELEPEELEAIDRRLRALARRLVGDEHRASDLVQDAWVSALSRRGTPVRRLSAWLSAVVRRSTVRDASEARRRADIERQTGARREEVVDSSVDLRDAAVALGRVIDDLGDPYGEVLRLHYLDELPVAEIATRLNRSPNTVRSQLSRGIDRLRERLEARDDLRPVIVALAHPRSAEALHALAPPSMLVPALALAVAALLVVVMLELRSRELPSQTTDVVAAPIDAPLPDVETLASNVEQGVRRAGMSGGQAPVDFGRPSSPAADLPDEFALRLRIDVLNADGSPARNAGLKFGGLSDLPVDHVARDGRFDVVVDERRLQTLNGDPTVWLRVVSTDEAWSTACNVRFRAREVAFELRTRGPLAELEGRIVDPAGVAVEGAQVTITPTSSEFVGPIAPDVSLSLVGFDKLSGPDGRFQFSSVAGGLWDLQVSAEGYGDSEQPIQLNAGAQEIEVALAEPRILTGRVLDPDGAPAMGARVWVPDPDSVTRPSREVETDADGRFEIVGVPARLWVFAEVSSDSTIYASRHVRMGDDGRSEVDLVLADRPGVSFDLEGVDGAPVAHQVLVILCLHDDTIWGTSVEADETGRAHLPRAPTQSFTVLRGGRPMGEYEELALDVVERDEAYTIVVPPDANPTAEVTATLIDARGDALEDVDIELVSAGPVVDLGEDSRLGVERWSAVYHSGFGTFQVGRLPALAFYVEAFVEERGVAVFGPFEVEDSASVDLGELVMPQVRRVQVDWGGDPPSPQSTWSLAATDISLTRTERVVSSFIENESELALFPGSYVLIRDGSDQRVRFEVAADGAAVVRIGALSRTGAPPPQRPLSVSGTER